MMQETSVKTDYSAFLLRLWRESTSGQWRVTLKDVSSGRQRNFSDLATLFDYLTDREQQGLSGEGD